MAQADSLERLSKIKSDTVAAVKNSNQNKDQLSRNPGSAPLLSDTISADTSLAQQGARDTVMVTMPPSFNSPLPKLYTGIDSAYARFLRNPFLPIAGKPVYQIVKVRVPETKDQLFYLLTGLVFYLALIKWMFSRYYQNLFRLFYQPSFRQKQTREQLLQSNFPSLLLNMFFIISAGTFIALLAGHQQLISFSFWKTLLYCVIALSILYAGKYVLIGFSGWVFDAKEAASTYTFAVYLINKILGILLVPFIFLLAFATPQLIEISITILLLLTILMFIYRYIISYSSVRREVKVSVLHFILYVLAFEVLPLLFIYKLLILYLSRTL